MTRLYLWLAPLALAVTTQAALPVKASTQVAANIRYVEYNADTVIRLMGHTGYQMMLEFEPGEKIETVGIGDSTGWQVTPNGAGTIMFLKPVGLPPMTNISIITNQRRYNFELVAKSGLRVPQSQITYAVRFRYPEKAGAVGAMATPPYLIATASELQNRAYSFDGAKANVPQQVFDDGKATYFQFAAGSSKPAIFAVTPGAGESVVNFVVRGPYIVVEQIAPQFVLRDGKEVTIIFNEGYTTLPLGADAPRQRPAKKCGFFGCKSREAKP